MSKKMWDGRFSKNTDKEVNDFNSSISFDYRLFKHDIMGSIAHAQMLCDKNIISQEDCRNILTGLKEIKDELKSGKLLFDPQAEDIHMFIEQELTSRIGDAGKRLHTGRSRNDQVALDLKMYLRDEICEIKKSLSVLINSLIEISHDNIRTIMPGYTHLQRAQPITLAHHLSAYIQMFLRDISRLNDCAHRMNTMPLGSGALAATTYDLDRMCVTLNLNFDFPTFNSLDAVSDRDHVIELISALSIIMTHLSRFSEEIILWATSEFSFIELDDAFSTGSSIMPQKKNPDIAELVRGKTGRVYGDLMGILTVMKGLPLAYNKDMQEDKELVFDAIDTIKVCLNPFTGMIKTMKINKGKMLEAAKGGFTNATDLADYLVKKGIPFRDAHEVSGKLVKYCIDNKLALSDVEISKYKEFSQLIQKDIYEAISMETCVNERKIIGGPAIETVRKTLDASSHMLTELMHK